MKDSLYGAILFEEGKDFNTIGINRKFKRKDFNFKGVLAICNGTPEQFSTREELIKLLNTYQDTVFISNLSKEKCWMLGRFEQVKNEHFLGVNIKGLLASHFFTANIKENTKILAEVFYRVMCFLIEKNNKFEQLGEGDLKEAIHDHIFPAFFRKHFNKEVEKPINHGFSEIYQEVVSLAKNDHVFTNTPKISLYCGRIPFIKNVLNQDIPINKEANWIKHNFPLDFNNNDKRRFLEETDLDFMVVIDNVSYKHGNFSVNTGKVFLGNRSQRLNNTIQDYIWLTSLEYHYIADSLDFEILEVYIQDKKVTSFNIGHYINDKFINIQKYYEENKLSALSLSFGVFLNGLYQSLIDVTHDGKFRVQTPFNEFQAWLQSKAKIEMTKKINEIYKHLPNLPILGYTIHGEIYLDSSVDLYNIELQRILLKQGFIIPQKYCVYDLLKEDFYSLFEENGNVTFYNSYDEVLLNAYLDYWVKYNWAKSVLKSKIDERGDFNEFKEELSKPIMLYFDRLFNLKQREFTNENFQRFINNTINHIIQVIEGSHKSSDSNKVLNHIQSNISAIMERFLN